MATVRKTISLSENQDAWIKSRIARGEFTNDSEYICDLVKRDQSQQDRLAKLREAIAEGLDSGPSDQSLDAIWTAAEDRATHG
ncbi:type II toxin-antitoxin system ParD family antitoxin [Parasphingorhabdus sp.]|uniref:type II toxin-antitoxin system ParD family antitoxin n=1 Tax=Parasphingorhabdus sp. TaxID=2709688 RepID=UPI003A923CF8